MRDIHEKKVLLIEDDTDTYETLELIIKEMGFDLVGFRDILPLSDIKHIGPDLIILDQRLRNGLGGLLCRAIKSSSVGKRFPILFISAYPHSDIIFKQCKAEYYLTIPFDLRRFQYAIHQFLDRA